ncbi:response regulator [Spirosoma aerophilum]
MPLRPDQHCEVVLIDDDDDDFYLLQHAFHVYSKQITLHHLTDGSRLLSPFQTATTLPSLVLLDMHMPGVDGYEVLRSLKSDVNLKNIPVVVWSGLLSDTQVNACYEAGASSVVFKSGDQAGLDLVVKQLCEYWFSAVRLPFYPKLSDC